MTKSTKSTVPKEAAAVIYRRVVAVEGRVHFLAAEVRMTERSLEIWRREAEKSEIGKAMFEQYGIVLKAQKVMLDTMSAWRARLLTEWNEADRAERMANVAPNPKPKPRAKPARPPRKRLGHAPELNTPLE